MFFESEKKEIRKNVDLIREIFNQVENRIQLKKINDNYSDKEKQSEIDWIKTLKIHLNVIAI